MIAVAVLAQLGDLFDTTGWLMILIGGMSCPLLGFAIRRLRGVATDSEFAGRLAAYYIICIPMFVLSMAGLWPGIFCVLLPVALAGFPAGFMIATSGRERIPPFGCHQCGYDLTGNVSGTCPECGTPAPRQETDAAGAAPPTESNEQA